MKRRRPQLGGQASMVLLAVALSACTAIGHEKVAGWPALRVVEHHVPHAAMRDRCTKYVGFGMSPEACAEFDFAARRCDLWFSSDFPPQRWIVEHERLHCQGYDHVGMKSMTEMLARWRGNHEATASAGATSR